ncbi:hypothetical protein [Parasitella parasitica]|uniref:Cyclin N-terminal domain-containing protein n=1 Tax=Parasitella parasitica TaxID=35722 RepID=A0A0B7MVB4_9FUNG|nr:hypothetical protein [Parasitella parasitica]
MAKKNLKRRSSQRKEQSERDKAKFLSDQSVYGQVAAFRQWLGMIQSQGLHGKYLPIPYDMIDLAASFIASVMNGVTNDLLFMTTTLAQSQNYRENVNFIRKTLSKAQISCSSLICSLWYIDQYFQQPIKKMKWRTKDLFLASIVVADKYMADTAWLNSDWSEWTHFTYSNQEINAVERRFLQDMNFNLYISELSYSNFVSYLEFRLHSRQLLGDVLLLSYRDIDVLSQALNPVYVKRLQLNLRPFEAMILLAKQAVSVFVVYTATLITLVSAGYVLSCHVDMMSLMHDKDKIAMMIMRGIDHFNAQSGNTQISTHDKASKIVELCINAIDASAPINISFFTQPVSKAVVDRIKAMEDVYSQSRLYQFLLKKGVYPTLLFSIASGAVSYGAYHIYSRSTKLTLNLLGVVYPTYRCWHLVKSQLNNGQEEQLKSWLTYWVIFGSFQVLDHWMASDLFAFSKKKYNLYKLLILYWAQSPHSKGALLLYRHVIQKPDSKASDRNEEEERKKEQPPILGKKQQLEKYRILDGYGPSSLIASTSTIIENHNDSDNSVSSSSSSNSSGDGDPLGLKYHHEDHHSTYSILNEKEMYPSSLMSASAAAW